MANIFLDTNIIIDFLDNSRINHNNAVNLFEKLIIEEHSVFISEDMLSTIYYLVKNKKKVLHFIKEILEFWNVVSFDKDVIKKAIEMSIDKNFDFEDLLQCFCAKKYGCVIITNDKKFVHCGVKVIGYEEFLD
ncbi:MAG: type II toxin-antitoxin system VapC family toxin [Nautiliaceae bacterium]